jgi:hypothetical protein
MQRGSEGLVLVGQKKSIYDKKKKEEEEESHVLSLYCFGVEALTDRNQSG